MHLDLMAANGDFAKFVIEFGSKESELVNEEAERNRQVMSSYCFSLTA